MSTNKSPKTRKAGEPAYPKQKPALRLLKPKSECSTTSRITELSEEVKATLDDMNRRYRVQRTRVETGDDTPDAA
jgi:hypothetical protein